MNAPKYLPTLLVIMYAMKITNAATKVAILLLSKIDVADTAKDAPDKNKE